MTMSPDARAARVVQSVVPIAGHELDETSRPEIGDQAGDRRHRVPATAGLAAGVSSATTMSVDAKFTRGYAFEQEA
jgi:hypothetical protein